jgi:hypothetical protein
MGMVEKVARAIYNRPTRLDGDEIAVHLGNSMMIDGSAVDAADLERIVMQVCEDAARAAIEAMAEPSEEMLAATGWSGLKWAPDAYQAMIKAALEE